MSYAADQIAKRLQFCSVAQRFNIMSAVLPVMTHVPAFGTTPSAPITNKILGIPLATIEAEFELHALHRTPVVTAWEGERGAEGFDVFGACKLTRYGDATIGFNQGSTFYPLQNLMWFGMEARRMQQGGPAWLGANNYTRYSRDGLFFGSGYARFGQVPFVVLTAPEGDIQNSNISAITEDLYLGSPLAIQLPRLSVIASDGTHTCGPNTIGFSQSALQAVPAGSVQSRVWAAYSLSGFGPSVTHRGLVKVDNILSPALAGPTSGDLTAVGPLAGKGNKFVGFGASGTTVSGWGLASGSWRGQRWSFPRSLNLTLSEMGGFYYGRRALDHTDMQKLYYAGVVNATLHLAPQQNPTRALGYLESMSHRQISKLIDGIAAGTVDPQTDTPAAVWDAVR